MTTRDLFDVLIQENSRMLWAFLRGVATGRDAEDLYQETCLTAWRAIDRYDKSRPFGPWLRGIAARTVLAHRRRRDQGIPLSEAVLQALEERFDRLTRLRGDSWEDKMDALRDCLSGLETEDRNLLDGFYRDGLSTERMSEKLGMSRELVKKRLQRARAALALCVLGKAGP